MIRCVTAILLRIALILHLHQTILTSYGAAAIIERLLIIDMVLSIIIARLNRKLNLALPSSLAATLPKFGSHSHIDRLILLYLLKLLALLHLLQLLPRQPHHILKYLHMRKCTLVIIQLHVILLFLVQLLQLLLLHLPLLLLRHLINHRTIRTYLRLTRTNSMLLRRGGILHLVLWAHLSRPHLGAGRLYFLILAQERLLGVGGSRVGDHRLCKLHLAPPLILHLLLNLLLLQASCHTILNV